MADDRDGSPFEEVEVECADEAAAKAEAYRRQAVEYDPAAEWIYLHKKQQTWVCRRVRRDGGPPEPKSFLAALWDVFPWF